ncbi:amidohydrolase [Pontibacter sp. BT310]|uniref:Amidohydrolase n=1 Tax=Pontibacter populi TaxID=890055 RepID=A0ABS6X7R1_9BACT|nr:MULTISPECIES: M20 family metallopeptidase [Pontibacter]MBJ6117183.1 amidohydrolase [Pontibacter sp. BT310]MBR0569608.1 amidohydrolase [Microvirga sp. STS03]MBW3364036.1 amidohydrolase [Pontibacter populi]
MNKADKIKELAKTYAPDTVQVRRHIHANPELSFEEYNTAAYVKQTLGSYGIVAETMAETGLVALIKGKNPEKKTIALRADLDALPIVEANEVDYRSKNEGVMHACGHDVHTASLLGAARILQELREEFEGTIKLVFQPGEEKFPGGASIMIKEGVLQNPAPEGIIGQHVFPLLPTGKVGFRSGMYMASADEIYITVKGKGGHAAMPEMNIDPVLISAHLIVALQQIVSRHASPKTPTVLSFGKIEAKGATNVIPNEVKIEGTFRTMNEVWRKEAHQKIKKLAESLCESMGGSCEIDIKNGYPFLQNDPELTGRTRAAAELYLGEENVVDLDLWMGAEDFAYYSQEVPACFYRLGTRNEARGIISGVHTPTFDIDETALETSIGLMAFVALQELKS